MMKQTNGEAVIATLVSVGVAVLMITTIVNFFSQPIEEDFAYQRLQWEMETYGEIREGVSCTTYGEGGRYEFTTCR